MSEPAAPFHRFAEWLADAEAREPNNPTAMNVATVGPDGRPLPLKRNGVMVAFGLQTFDKTSRALDLGRISLE